MKRNGYLEIFSLPQVIENCRQFLLLRTDILQKTVVGSFQAQPVYLHRKGEGSLLLSEFECPRTILIKQQQQQQHIFFIKKLKKKITLDMVPSTLDMEPSTLDPRRKDRLHFDWSFLDANIVEHFIIFPKQLSLNALCCITL